MRITMAKLNTKSSCCLRKPRLSGLSAIVPLLLLLSLLGHLSTTDAQQLGALTPSGKVDRLVGQELRLLCNLFNVTPEVNSRHLSFTENRKRTVDQYVRTVNDSAIELVIPRVTQKGDHVYTCRHKSTGVAYKEVVVGYAPLPVTHFRCISNNWEKLNCTFQYEFNPIPTNYAVSYRRAEDDFSNVEVLKPNATVGVFSFEVKEYKRVVENMTFQLNQSNVFGELSQIFDVSIVKCIRPSPPYDLNHTQVGEEPVVLRWKTDYQLKPYGIMFGGDILTEVNYKLNKKDEWISQQLHLDSAVDTNQGYNLTLDKLYPNKWYGIRIRMRMSLSDPTREELWSDYASYSLMTNSRKPDRPPTTDIGGFSVNNDVVIYWEMLEGYERNGNNASYEISRSLVDGRPANLNASISNTMARLNVDKLKDRELEFEIRSTNAEGRSEQASRVRVPPIHDRVPYPREIKKSRNGTIYTLSWKEPKKDAKNRTLGLTSYTVFWCKSKAELPNQCEETIRFQQVDATQREFTLNTTEGINFALSANTENSSSGMAWAMCTAGKSDDIGTLKTIYTSQITFNSMDIKWSVDCVDKPIVRHFFIDYCAITDPHNLTCREGTERNATLGANSTQFTLTDLTPYTTYITKITMHSDTRAGQPSEPTMNTTYEGKPSPPQNLRIVDVRNTSVVLSWDPPKHKNGVVSRYKVSYNGNTEKVEESELIRNNMTYELRGLTGHTHYEIVVCASSNCCDCSESSNTRNITTKIATPGMVDRGPSAGNDKTRTVDITWIPPKQKAGRLDFYEVRVHTTTDNRTTVSRINDTSCTLDLYTDSSEKEPKWTVQVRAVNVEWSAHKKPGNYNSVVELEGLWDMDSGTSTENPTTRFQRHSGSGEQLPRAQDLNAVENSKHMVKSAPRESPVKQLHSCTQNDRSVLEALSLDSFHETMPGPWNDVYVHTGNPNPKLWTVFLAIAIVLCMLAGLAYVSKNFFRLKKGSVVLPPGLTDIAAKPLADGGKGAGGRGGLLGHGNGTILGTDAMGVRAHVDELYEVKGNGTPNGELQMTFEERQTQGRDASDLGHRAMAIDMALHSETNSLHEQERSLLDDRMETQSSGSSSSMLEHEEGPMLGLSGSGCQEEDELQQETQQNRTLHQDVLEAMTKIKQQQQQQIQHAVPVHMPPPKMEIKPVGNGYVQVQRAGGYVKLGDAMKPLPLVSTATEDTGITGYVTHKQLADFGRMQ